MTTYLYSMTCAYCGTYLRKSTTKDLYAAKCPTCGAMAVRTAAKPRTMKEMKADYEKRSLDRAGLVLAREKLRAATDAYATAARALQAAQALANRLAAVARHDGSSLAIAEAAKAASAADEAEARCKAAKAAMDHAAAQVRRFESLTAG